jgi:hypothetical protein
VCSSFVDLFYRKQFDNLFFYSYTLLAAIKQLCNGNDNRSVRPSICGHYMYLYRHSSRQGPGQVRTWVTLNYVSRSNFKSKGQLQLGCHPAIFSTAACLVHLAHFGPFASLNFCFGTFGVDFFGHIASLMCSPPSLRCSFQMLLYRNALQVNNMHV